MADSETLADAETSQNHLLPAVPIQSLSAQSDPATAATSVQTFAPDEEKTEMDNMNLNGVMTPETQDGECEARSNNNNATDSQTESTTKLMEEVPSRTSVSIPAAQTENVDFTPSAAPPSTVVPILQTPQTSLTFLLVSGKRRTMSFEPQTMIGRVKELVWNAWPNEWQDERPPGPSYLRILYLGKILQDDDTLTKLSFPSSLPSNPSCPPTIVHLSIRPYAPPNSDDDDQLKKKKTRRSRMVPSADRRSTADDMTNANVGAGTGARGEEDEGAGGCCGGCIIC